MKKLFVFILLTLTTIACYSQWFSIGAKIGYSSTLKTEQNYPKVFSVENKLQNGFHIGLYARLGRRVYAQPEVLYNFQGYKTIIEPAKGNSSIYNYKISTIDIPLLAGASIINSNFFKLRFMVGPKLSFNAGSTKAKEIQKKYTERTQTTRVGLDCGLGFDVWRITIDVRYNMMPNLYKLEDGDNNLLNPQALHSFQVSAGFRIFGQNNDR